MKNSFIFSLIAILSFSIFAYSEARKSDPNLNRKSSKATVIAPGCTEFVHPCSGQAAVASLNAATTPSGQVGIKPPASAASGARTK